MRLLILLFCVIGLSSCGVLSPTHTANLPTQHTKNLSKLRVPPGVNIDFDTLYPIPKAHYSQTTQINTTPPGL